MYIHTHIYVYIHKGLCILPPRYVHIQVYIYSIHDSKKAESASKSINRRMDNKNILHTHGKISLLQRKMKFWKLYKNGSNWKMWYCELSKYYRLYLKHILLCKFYICAFTRSECGQRSGYWKRFMKEGKTRVERVYRLHVTWKVEMRKNRQVSRNCREMEREGRGWERTKWSMCDSAIRKPVTLCGD